jgi:hypothetical protein
MFAVVAITVLAVSGLAEAQNVEVIPSSLAFNLTVGENVTVSVNMTSNDSTIYDEVYFNSTHLIGYVPTGSHLDQGIPKTFNLTIGVAEYERPDDETNTISVGINETIQIKALNETAEIAIGEIGLEINLTVPGPEIPKRDYLFRRCFIENNKEFCAEFNVSELQNITIINETTENLSYTILMPFNITRDFMQSYADMLDNASRYMEESKDAIVRSVEESIALQQRQNNIFRNTFHLESYLKNPEVPLWIEITPNNMLQNVTGLSDEEFMEALNMLFQDNKLSQRTDTETVTIPFQSGYTVQEVQKIYVASTERVFTQTQSESAFNAILVAVIIAILSIAGVLFYSFVWRGRVGKL